MFENVKRTAIADKKEFTFEGDRIVQKECVDQERQIYVYERYSSSGRLMGYEVVRGVKKKDGDGEVKYVYPRSEEFGSYGYFISAQWKDDIDKYVKKLKEKGQK